jgi:hypothetical protein
MRSLVANVAASPTEACNQTAIPKTEDGLQVALKIERGMYRFK